MIIWFAIFASLAGAGMIALFFYLGGRRRRQKRLELRLLAGRQRLLGEELERCTADLQEFDQEELAALRQEAENALDQLHVALIERQAHLLNYEDLAHLQQCKIDILDAACAEIEAVPPPSSHEPAPTPPPPRKERSELENQLLDKINRLHKRPRK